MNGAGWEAAESETTTCFFESKPSIKSDLLQESCSLKCDTGRLRKNYLNTKKSPLLKWALYIL
jgi:hypothetical protein